MNCSSVDLKAYLLSEVSGAERSAVEDHVHGCSGCREEMERLRLTQTALLALEDEEVPQRIAFVSDKVFEPHWYQTIWRSGPAMGFASAALLAAAILVHGFARPIVTVAPGPTVETAQVDQRIEKEVKSRLEAAEAKQAQQMTALLDAAEKRFEAKRQADLAVVREAARYYEQKTAQLMVAVNREPRTTQ